MWSWATEELGRRYHAMYGFTQGVWVSMLVVWIARQVTPGWESLALFVVGTAASVYWQRCWRKYRAAFWADTDAELEALGAERQ